MGFESNWHLVTNGLPMLSTGVIVSVAICSPQPIVRAGLRKILGRGESSLVLETPEPLDQTIAWIQNTRPDILLYEVRSNTAALALLCKYEEAEGIPVFPQLLQRRRFTVYRYCVLTGFGFLFTILWLIPLTKKEGIPPVKVEGLALVIVLTAGIGSKPLTALDYPGFCSGDWNQLWSQVSNRGGVFYGGFLLAVAGSALYFWLAKLPGWQVADCVAPGLGLAQGMGRAGCFLAGRCWDAPIHLPWAVIFTSRLAHRITGVVLHFPLHPTQLYEAAPVLLSIPLLWLRKRKAFAGGVMLVCALYYAVVRFFLEFLRGDPRGYYFNRLLSTSQLINLVIVPAALSLLLRLRKHANFAKQSNHRPSGALVLSKARTKTI